MIKEIGGVMSSRDQDITCIKGCLEERKVHERLFDTCHVFIRTSHCAFAEETGIMQTKSHAKAISTIVPVTKGFVR